MSAYIVAKPHIDLLVTAARCHRPGQHDSGLRWYVDGILEGNRRRRGSALGGRSDVVAREPRERRLPLPRRHVRCPTGTGESDATMTSTLTDSSHYPGAVEPVVVLGALACYEYQSCEHPGWKTSEAYEFCDALRHKMIRMLPGYTRAPWSIDDDHVFGA